jgi:hypothetical protein
MALAFGLQKAKKEEEIKVHNITKSLITKSFSCKIIESGMKNVYKGCILRI